MSLSDWLGLAGVLVGLAGVGVSGGAWVWAVRANRTAGRAENEAHDAKLAVASLAERFAAAAEHEADLLVYRLGSGVTVINKSRGLMRGVQLGPAESFRWDDPVELGDLEELAAGAANVGAKYPDWSNATQAFVYWLTPDQHRRVNVFPIFEADPAVIAEALGGLKQEPRAAQ